MKKGRNLHLNSSQLLFTVRVVRLWKKLPRMVAESPSLEILNTQLEMVLGNLLYLTLFEQRHWSGSRDPF